MENSACFFLLSAVQRSVGFLHSACIVPFVPLRDRPECGVHLCEFRFEVWIREPSGGSFGVLLLGSFSHRIFDNSSNGKIASTASHRIYEFSRASCREECVQRSSRNRVSLCVCVRECDATTTTAVGKLFSFFGFCHWTRLKSADSSVWMIPSRNQ